MPTPNECLQAKLRDMRDRGIIIDEIYGVHEKKCYSGHRHVFRDSCLSLGIGPLPPPGNIFSIWGVSMAETITMLQAQCANKQDLLEREIEFTGNTVKYPAYTTMNDKHHKPAKRRKLLRKSRK